MGTVALAFWLTQSLALGLTAVITVAACGALAWLGGLLVIDWRIVRRWGEEGDD